MWGSSNGACYEAKVTSIFVTCFLLLQKLKAGDKLPTFPVEIYHITNEKAIMIKMLSTENVNNDTQMIPGISIHTLDRSQHLICRLLVTFPHTKRVCKYAERISCLAYEPNAPSGCYCSYIRKAGLWNGNVASLILL